MVGHKVVHYFYILVIKNKLNYRTIVATLFQSLKISFFQNFAKRKSTNKIIFCDPKTPLEKQNELKKYINNKRTKLDTQENISSDNLFEITSNLINTEMTVASISNVTTTENNAEGSSSTNQ